MSDDSPAENEESWVFRCPDCGWEIVVTVDVDRGASDGHRPALRCLRTEAHEDGLLAEMEVVES